MAMFRVWFWIPVGAVLIPSTLLHFKVLHTVWKGKRVFPYNSLFYRLFLVQSLIEIPLLFLHIACRLLTKDRLLDTATIVSTNGGFFPPLYNYGTIFYFLYVQVWGVSVQSLVRCLAVCAPTSKIKQWVDTTPGIAWLCIEVLVPFAILFRQLVQDPISFGINEDGNTFLSMPPHVFQWNTTQPVIVTAIGAIFSAGCYILTLRKLLGSNSEQYSREHHREKVLTVVGFSLFLALCTMTGYYIIAAISAFNIVLLGTVFKDLYFVPVMLLTFINPWILTLTNKTLRKSVFGIPRVSSGLHTNAIKPASDRHSRETNIDDHQLRDYHGNR